MLATFAGSNVLEYIEHSELPLSTYLERFTQTNRYYKPLLRHLFIPSTSLQSHVKPTTAYLLVQDSPPGT